MTFRCGSVRVKITHLRETRNGRNVWKFRVTQNRRVLCEGSDLETPAFVGEDHRRAAQEVLAFMCYSDSDARQKWGWTFDADALMASLNTSYGGSETQFRVWSV